MSLVKENYLLKKSNYIKKSQFNKIKALHGYNSILLKDVTVAQLVRALVS